MKTIAPRHLRLSFTSGSINPAAGVRRPERCVTTNETGGGGGFAGFKPGCLN